MEQDHQYSGHPDLPGGQRRQPAAGRRASSLPELRCIFGRSMSVQGEWHHQNSPPHRLQPINVGHKQNLNRKPYGRDVCFLQASGTSFCHCHRLESQGRQIVIARNRASQSRSMISPANRSPMASSIARKNQSVSVAPNSTSSSPASFSTLMVAFRETNGLPTPARRLVIRAA